MTTAADQNPSGVELSLVIPAYNEGGGIGDSVARAGTVLAGLVSSYEIIVVDDSSTDDTVDALSKAADQIPALRVISLHVNVGQHIATVVGLRAAKGRMIIVSDADEHVPFDNLPSLYKAAIANPQAEVVSGARAKRNAAWQREIGSRVVSLLVNRMTGMRLADPATTFRLFRREAAAKVLQADILAQSMPILVGHMRLRVVEIPVTVRSDAVRASRYDTIKLVNVLLLAILNFSSGTTTILSLMLLGCVSATFGGLGLVVLVVNGMLSQVPLPTNWLLFFILLLIIGLQFVMIGTVAYKLERINVNLKFRKRLEAVRHGLED